MQQEKDTSSLVLYIGGFRVVTTADFLVVTGADFDIAPQDNVHRKTGQYGLPFT